MTGFELYLVVFAAFAAGVFFGMRAERANQEDQRRDDERLRATVDEIFGR